MTGQRPAGPQVFRFDASAEYYFREGCHIVETLNNPADPLVSIVRARVEAGGVTRWHRLRDTWERYVILEGKGQAFVGDQQHELYAGDVLLIPPGVPQRIKNAGPGELVFLAVCSPRFRPECYLQGRGLEE